MIKISKKYFLKLKFFFNSLLKREVLLKINKAQQNQTKIFIQKKLHYDDHFSYDQNLNHFLRTIKRKHKYLMNPVVSEELMIHLFHLKFYDKSQNLSLSKVETECTSYIKQTNAILLNTNQWIGIYYFVGDLGRFILANEFRKKAIERTLKYSSDKLLSPFKVMHLFNCYMELGNLDSAHSLLKKITRSGFRFLYPISKMRLYLDLFLPKEKYQFGSKTKDIDFSNLIKDKNIALVGPAPTEYLNGNVIDSFEIVIRLNYHGSSLKKNVNKKGKRIDISYYNGENGNHLISKQYGFLNKLKFIVFKNKYAYKVISTSKYIHTKSRRLTYFPFEFVGDWNMVQIAILDLLIYNPGKLKLFNVTFFISSINYEQNYQLDYQKIRPLEDDWKAITKHNQITQLQLIRNLHNYKKIVLDSEILNIINLDENEYLNQLQSKFN